LKYYCIKQHDITGLLIIYTVYSICFSDFYRSVSNGTACFCIISNYVNHCVVSGITFTIYIKGAAPKTVSPVYSTTAVPSALVKKVPPVVFQRYSISSSARGPDTDNWIPRTAEDKGEYEFGAASIVILLWVLLQPNRKNKRTIDRTEISDFFILYPKIIVPGFTSAILNR